MMSCRRSSLLPVSGSHGCWWAVLATCTIIVGTACEPTSNDPLIDLAIARGGIPLVDGGVIDFGSVPLEDVSTPVVVDLTLTNRASEIFSFQTGSPVVIENDSSLAFRLLLPRVSEVAAGASVQFSVMFRPARAGTWEAKLVLKPDSRRLFPLVVQLVARATASEIVPVTGARIVDTTGNNLKTLDFGNIPGDSERTLTFALENVGNTDIDISALEIDVSPDMSDFALRLPPAGNIAPGARASFEVTAKAAGCGTTRAVIDIGLGDSGPTFGSLQLLMSSVPETIKLPAFMPTSSSYEVVHSIALAAPEDGVARVLLGKSDAQSFRGTVRLLDFDGCSATNPATIDDPGLTNLWGHRVAMNLTGDLALVTWLDRTEARLLAISGPSPATTPGVRLGTFISGGGHGQAAALSGDGGVALVGQRYADSGFNAHGGIWLYEKVGAVWTDMPETRFRLMPLEPQRIEGLGTNVAASATGDVIIGGARYRSNIAVNDVYEAALFVWVASIDPARGRTWGRIVPQMDSDRRAETQMLRTETIPFDEDMRVGMSLDGTVVAIAFKSDVQQLEVHLFEVGDDGLWGLIGNPTTRRIANHVSTVEAYDDWGFALSPGGDRFVVSDSGGVVAVQRSQDKWGFGSQLGGTWAIPLAGPIVFTNDGKTIAGVDSGGDLHVIRLDGD